MTGTEIPVLIVGGGPIGFAVALDLARRGQRSMVVEREAGTAIELLAKAGTLNERTMEICRSWGIADRIANCGFPSDYPRDNIYCTGIDGFFMGRDHLHSADDRPVPPYAAEMLRKCPQHLFDPLIAKAAIETGLVDVRYSTNYVRLEQDAKHVTAWVEGPEGEYAVRASYVVGCDGGASKVRQDLAISWEGTRLDNSLSLMLRIPELWKYHPWGKAERFLFIGPQGTFANLTMVDGTDIYRLTLVGSQERLDVDLIDIRSEVQKALGPDVPFEVLRVVPWWRAQMLAGQFRIGRVFLAGDAAHTTSPTGGHGLNTGIGDAQDLGWILDAVLSGWGGKKLLAAYEAERRPVALRNASGSTRNYRAWLDMGRDKVCDDSAQGESQRAAVYEAMSASLQQEWHSHGVGLGYRYEGSPVIVPDGTPEPADDPTHYKQTARPGHRAPHAWIRRDFSTLDLFGQGYVLLRFAGAPDAAALENAAQQAGVPLTVSEIDDPVIAALYEKPLVLVRPDGMVAWRGANLPEDVDHLIGVVRGV